MVFIIVFVIPAMIWLIFNVYNMYSEETKEKYNRIFYCILACAVLSFLMFACLPANYFWGAFSIVLFFGCICLSAIIDGRNGNSQRNDAISALASIIVAASSSHSEKDHEIDRWHCEKCGGWVDDDGECEDCGHYNAHTW